MNPVPETAVLDAVLGSCELQMRAAIDHLATLQATLVAEADRLGQIERALGDLSAGSRTLVEADPPRPTASLAAGAGGPALAWPAPASAEAAAAPGEGRAAGTLGSANTPQATAATTPNAAPVVAVRLPALPPARPRSRFPPRLPGLRLRRLPHAVGWGIAGSAVAVLVVATIVLGRGAPPQEVGLLLVARETTVVRLQGTVRLWQPPTGWTFVEGGASVWPGDRLLTDAQSHATLTWPNGASASLAAGGSLVLAPAATDGTIRVELGEGALWLDGGREAGSPRVEAVTPDGVRVSGARFDARRDAGGRLVVTSADAPVAVWAQDTRRDLPPASTSEVLAGQRPTLARPITVPPALAITVDGPEAWVLADDLGRIVGAPPGGGPWVDQVPAVRGPLPRPQGAGVLVPDPRGEYQLVLWAGESPRPYRVAAWPTSGQTLFGGPPPAEAGGVVRSDGTIPARGAITLALSAEPRAVTLRGGARPASAPPSWLRLAVAPDLPTAPIASPPAAREADAPAPAGLALGPSPDQPPAAVQASPAPERGPEPANMAADPGSAAETAPSGEGATAAIAPDAADESASPAEQGETTVAAGESDAAEASQSYPSPGERGPAASFGGPLPAPRGTPSTAVSGSADQARAASPTPVPSATRDPETLPRVAAPALVGTTTISSGVVDSAAGLPSGASAQATKAAAATTPTPLGGNQFPTPAFATPTLVLPVVRPPTIVLPNGTRAPTTVTLGGFATVAVPATAVPVRPAQPAAPGGPLAPAGSAPGGPLAPGASVPGVPLAPGASAPGAPLAPGAPAPGAPAAPAASAPGAPLGPGAPSSSSRR